jgi:glucose/arabinose dehydrogenase
MTLFVVVALLSCAVVFAGSCGKKQQVKQQTTSPGGTTTAPGKPAAPGTNTTGMLLELPAGFSISFFAQGLGNPRVIAWDSTGTMLVSVTGDGKVVALPDTDNNGVADRVITVAGGLNEPHGLAFLPSDPRRLYIAETDQVAIWDYDPASHTAANKRKIIDLPGGGRHFTRTLLFLPPPNDDKLLIAVGSSVDVGYETDWRRADILVANADGSGLATYATGLRNSVFMAVYPVTRQVWATEMGRDYLGDNLPPDEINIIEQGGDYGWPTCYGKNVHDTSFDTKTYPPGVDPSAGKTRSYIDIPAHSAPLGLAFFDGAGWPVARYGHDLLVAYHGSWNRSVPTGYKVVRMHLDERGNYLGAEDFITGWLQPDGSVLGRPVAVSIRDDGVIYISDDDAGVIYRVTGP